MAGTYFPKNRFISVLTQINDFWVNRREDVNRQADSLANAAKRMSVPATTETVKLSAELMTAASAKFLDQFDE